MYSWGMKGERIQIRQDALNISNQEILSELNTTGATLSRWKNNKNEPDDITKLALAKILKTTVAYLLGETNDPAPLSTCDADVEQEKENYVKKPVHTAQFDDVIFVPIVSSKIVTACCGEGSPYATDVKWEVEDYFPVPATELIGYTWQGAKYTIMTAEGSSMEPFIRSGEMVLFAEGIDLGIGDVGVFSLNGRLLIRGLIKKNGVYVLRAHNWKEYSDLEIDTQTGDFFVIGKVLKVVSARSVPPVL